MKYKNLSLKWQIALPTITLAILGITITIFGVNIITTRIVIDQARTTALQGYRDTALNALTTMMISGNIKEAKGPFLEQMRSIVDLRIIRAESLDREFGKGPASDYAGDSVEREVLETGGERIMLAGDSIRGIFPYAASANFMNKNCLLCHHVSEGTVLGAVSIRMSLSGPLAKARALQHAMIIFGLIGVVLLVGLMLIIAGSIHKPLADLTARVEQIAHGDLRQHIAFTGRDEISVLAQSMNKMIESFSAMITSILSSANDVIHTVDILRSRARRTSEGAKSQTAQAIQIVAAAEEMSQTISDISKNAAAVAETSIEAKSAATAGEGITEIAVEKVNSVYNSTAELAARVEKLNSRVAEIGDIVSVIKGIADQTNLLALNAAIEAARAGEQGRGFAVVADEVRKLAERTIKATSEISGRIAGVQAESDHTTEFMGEATGQVTKAKEFIANVGTSLKTIVESVQKVNDQIARIATAVEEQSAASDGVAKNIELTSSISKDLETMSGSVSHDINGLLKIAEGLRNSTAGFRTAGSEFLILDLAKTDHRIFMDKIGSCLDGDTRIEPTQLPDHHSCRFGKWYFGEGKDKCAALDSFKAIDTPHEKIHAMAKDAVAASNAGDRSKAERIYREMEDISARIGELLDSIKRECT